MPECQATGRLEFHFAPLELSQHPSGRLWVDMEDDIYHAINPYRLRSFRDRERSSDSIGGFVVQA